MEVLRFDKDANVNVTELVSQSRNIRSTQIENGYISSPERKRPTVQAAYIKHKNVPEWSELQSGVRELCIEKSLKSRQELLSLEQRFLV